MKGSSATSATQTQAPRLTGQSSGRPRPTPRVDGFALTGPSNLPDPAVHAFRKDLADVGLAGQVLASHYADPVGRTLTAAATLRREPAEGADTIRELGAGEAFQLLEDSVGWAWGYAASDRRVGYVRSDALSPAN